MGSWLVVGVACLVALAVVVAALLASRPQRAAQPPDWTIPPPDAIRAAGFPLAWPGYDPAHVEALLAAVADAYEELYAAAGPDAIARARARLAQRQGGHTQGGHVPPGPTAAPQRDRR